MARIPVEQRRFYLAHPELLPKKKAAKQAKAAPAKPAKPAAEPVEEEPDNETPVEQEQ